MEGNLLHTVDLMYEKNAPPHIKSAPTLKNSHAYTCINHRIQLAVCDMTMIG